MRNIIAIVLAVSMVSLLHSQSVEPTVLASAGASGSSGDNSVEWTMGELSIQTLSNGDLNLTQGFHQPNVLLVSIDDDAPEVGLKIFPNPTQDQLIIEYLGEQELEFSLHDMRGVQALTGGISTGSHSVDVRLLPAGHYQLTIIKENQIIQSVTIEKTGL